MFLLEVFLGTIFGEGEILLLLGALIDVEEKVPQICMCVCCYESSVI